MTRDRITTLMRTDKRCFELVDTGGMGIQDIDNLTADIERQIQHAINEAELILFVADARAGLTPLDEQVAERLRPLNKPVLLVVNKSDAPEMDAHATDFFRLGFDRVTPVSAQQNRGKPELLRLIERYLPEEASPPEAVLKLAIVGRRNTGKSTFINNLAQSERMIVSEVAGTTRDSVDVRFERDGKVYVAIDTAGVRRKKSVATDIEFYSMHRAERSIRRADVVLLFLDPRWKISKVDKQLADYVLQHHKPAIFVINKWDLVKDIPTSKYGDYIHKTFPSLDYVPIAFITAKSGKNVQTVLNLAQNLFKQASARVSTGDLNRVVRQALEAQAPPMRQNRRPKVFYATQAEMNPPTIVLFTNGPGLLDNTYKRYLLKTFRDQLPFVDVPIKLLVRKRGREEGPDLEVAEPAAETPAPRKRKKPAKQREPELWEDV